VSRIVAFIVKKIILKFESMFSWLSQFSNCRNLTKIKAQELKYCLSRVKTDISACTTDVKTVACTHVYTHTVKRAKSLAHCVLVQRKTSASF